jgi:hypothetical protein
LDIVSSVDFGALGHVWSHALLRGAQCGPESVRGALIGASECVAIDAQDQRRVRMPEPVGDDAWREPGIQ